MGQADNEINAEHEERDLPLAMTALRAGPRRAIRPETSVGTGALAPASRGLAICDAREPMVASRSCLVVVVFAAIIAASCAHDPPCTTPEAMTVALRASSQLNPADGGESLATVVRVYQLKDTRKFSEAAIEELLDRDKDILGEDLVATRELTLAPGEVVEPALERQPHAAYIGVVAFYRQPSGNGWRASRKLPPPNPRHCHEKKKKPPAASLFFKDSRIESRS